MDGLGLTKVADSSLYAPRVRFMVSGRGVDRLRVRLLHGQTPGDLAVKAEALRHGLGAVRATVGEVRPGVVDVTCYSRDLLADVVPAIRLGGRADLSALPVGRAEDGRVFRLRLLSSHVLIAGATGSGKGSVLWSIIRASAPLIASGRVRLVGVDPKRMELVFGRGLFDRLAERRTEDMVGLLEAQVVEMLARGDRLSGKTRLHVATVEDPAVMIVVDELATLIAYCPDNALRKRAVSALSLLLSQGRSVGFYVIAAVQDPRKDVIGFRDLFPTRIALRLAEDSHTDMVLGDGAAEAGAACHLIPETTPGVGYVRVEGVKEPVRVRFTWVDDEDIAETAAYVTAHDQPPDAVDPAELPARPVAAPAL
jgi:S-DNA-T family DNA segregation ATPase FtsK/SpoIIIE